MHPINQFRANQWLVLADQPSQPMLLDLGMHQGLRLRYLGKQLGRGPYMVQWQGRTLAVDASLLQDLRFTALSNELELGYAGR